MLPKSDLRKFESYMMGKTGFGIYGKTLYFLDPQTCKKPRNFLGFFGVVSFLIYPSGFAEQKRSRILIALWGSTA